MLKKSLFASSVAVIFVLFMAFSSQSNSFSDAELEVKKVVEASYANGAFNKLDTDAMENGFHKDFAIFSPKGEEISKYPIKTWVDGIKKKKAKAGFDPEGSKLDYDFLSIDVTGNAAAVKIKYSRNDKPVYTDYLSLLKFDSGWKIVAKVYHAH